jgi:hypothetical protein
LFAQGDADDITDDVPSLLGWPASTFEPFAIDYAGRSREAQAPAAAVTATGARSGSNIYRRTPAQGRITDQEK